MNAVLVKDSSAVFLAELYRVKHAALSSAGSLAVQYARSAVPVETGRLRDSIGYAVSDGAVSVGTSVSYAPHVEFGVRGRGGVHFLRDALAMHIPEYKACMQSALRDDLKGGEEK